MNPLHEELTAYIDGELSPARAAEVEAALAADPALRAMEQRLRVSIAAIEGLPVPDTAPSPALRRAVLDAVNMPTWKEKWLTWPRLVPVGFALAAAVAVVAWPREDVGAMDEEKLLLAQNLDVVEDLDVIDLDSSADLDVVANLHELEVLQ